jgi:hypothetical protein
LAVPEVADAATAAHHGRGVARASVRWGPSMAFGRSFLATFVNWKEFTRVTVYNKKSKWNLKINLLT